jgi:Cu/Ag efflux protein CusF
MERFHHVAGPRSGAAAALLVAAALAGACRGGNSAADAAAAGSARHRYEVRAEVVRLPVLGRGSAQLTVRHEAIPRFVDSSGATAGMPAMVMAFDLAPTASAEGLRAGDKVEILLAVDWSRPLLLIEEVRRLPTETVLEFGRAEAGSQH